MQINHSETNIMSYSDNVFCRCLLGKILDEIDEHGIKIYHLPDAESDEDEDFKEQTRILKVNVLFPAKLPIPDIFFPTRLE